MPKKATKKAATKKVVSKSQPTAKKATGNKEPAKKKSLEVFDPMDPNNDYIERSKRALTSLRDKRKNRTVGFQTMAEVRQNMLPLGNFAMQWLTGTYGLPHKTLVSILGAEGLGKSSIAFMLMGWGLLAGSPCYIQNTEGKVLLPSRVKRMLSSNPDLAEFMLSRILIEEVHSLEHSVEALEDWVAVQRAMVPAATPLICVVDSWSKLMDPQAAVGRYDWGNNMDPKVKAKKKDIGGGSNMGHARFAQDWCRVLPDWLVVNNVVLILIEHQNDKVDMSGGFGGIAMPENVGNLYNKTKRGGRAFNQNCALQLIVARKGIYYDSQKNKIGETGAMRVEKNSYGPKNRQLEYQIITEHTKDSPNYLEPAIQMEEFLAKWFVDNKHLQTTVSSKRYASPVLGVVNVDATDFCNAFHLNTAAVNQLGKTLGIEGFNDVVDTVVDVLEKSPAEIPPAPPPMEMFNNTETHETDVDKTEDNNDVEEAE
jgi:RecA/RadA recombinase